MKLLVIPDIHLKPYIFDIADKLLQNGAADNTVCLMDIPDDWYKQMHYDEYVITFDAAINFAKRYPKSLWCYGNHDLSYVWKLSESGYSVYMEETVVAKLKELQDVLVDDNRIEYIKCIDNVLFSHGGLCERFVEGFVPQEKQKDVNSIVSHINSFGSAEMWQDDSPIWFRPQYRSSIWGEDSYIQVVGHTPVKRVSKTNSVISCDTFSTYNDGTPIGDASLCVIDTVTGKYSVIDKVEYTF